MSGDHEYALPGRLLNKEVESALGRVAGRSTEFLEDPAATGSWMQEILSTIARPEGRQDDDDSSISGLSRRCVRADNLEGKAKLVQILSRIALASKVSALMS